MSGLLNLETALNSLSNTSAGASFVIDTVTLLSTEIPSTVWLGGTQKLAVTELIGPGRTIRTLGAQPINLDWDGTLLGPSAQQRAQQLDRLRASGRLIGVSFGGYRYQAVISEFRWAYQARGAVSPYKISLVVQPQQTSAADASTSASSLANQVPSCISSATTTLSTAAANISTYATSLVNQATAISGQITPIASFLGAGGLVATVQNHLTAAYTLATAGENLSLAPATASGIITSLSAAGSGLTTLASQAGANLEGISGTGGTSGLFGAITNGPVAQVNADLASAAVDAGTQVNTAMKYVQTAAGMSVTLPVFHA